MTGNTTMIRPRPQVPRTEAYGVLARHLGATGLDADLRAVLDAIGAAVRGSPLAVPPAMAEVLSGGKRLRPLFVLATAWAGRTGAARLRERAVGGACAVELLHLASLVHDDLMDDAATRHGVATISARAGAGRALLAGDVLLGHAYTAAAGLGADAAALVGRTLVRLCEGQAEEAGHLFDADRSAHSYFSAIAGKTGALIEASCRMGALAAGYDAATGAALGRFGHHLGIAYQLLDDLTDLTEDSAALGKPTGHDLAEGVYTYPTIWALHHDPGLRPLLLDLARHDGPRAGPAAAAADRVRASGRSTRPGRRSPVSGAAAWTRWPSRATGSARGAWTCWRSWPSRPWTAASATTRTRRPGTRRSSPARRRSSRSRPGC
ncbi:polyprenyl synthetase family protein [Streptomyces sp. Q6]|uniref:Polyprenyl synthetase family protein n=1 Tax=Streptomyces citrinus TaxID=3118173 RepID=A0ACD5AHB5_9ACTN